MPASAREQLARDCADLLAARNHLAERFLAEVEFAEGLARLHPAKAKAWAKRIDQACGAVSGAVAAGRIDSLKKVVPEAEEVLAPIAKVAKTYTIHCVGHAHIDMNWLWSWPETVAVTNDTFTTVLRLMDEFPDFCFTQSQASVYAIMRDYHPELLKQMAARIAEGRWEVAAVHWVEGDKNIAAGEALARHLLYTRRFMQQTFGLKPEDILVDWEPDTFGHAHTIPSIDSRGGVTRYYLCRGGSFEKPPIFWWQGPDGSRLLVNRETTWYNDSIGPHNAAALLRFCEKTGLKDWMCVYGVGDHGGGPTRRDILRAHDMDAWPVYPHFRLATTRDYYALLEKNGDRWPVLDRELNYEFTGCYTSQSAIKQANRYGENFCLEGEAMASLAWRAVGREYPASMLHSSWINTLFGHFHDILPGSGVRPTREYQRGLFQNTAAATGIIKTESMRAIAAAVGTSFAARRVGPPAAPELASMALGAGVGRGATMGGMSSTAHVAEGPRGFVVFNPTAWPRCEVVTVTVWDVETGVPGGQEKSFIARSSEGRVVPAQRIAAGEYWGHRFVDLAFPASVGGLGYAAYVVEEGTAEPPPDGVKTAAGSRGPEMQPEGDFTLENELVAVAFDRNTGGIVRLVDKKTGRNLASPADPLAVLEYILERPRGMSAWILGDVKERRCPLALDGFSPELKGPYVATMVAKAKINQSTATLTFTLRAGQPYVEIALSATWLERGSSDQGAPTLRIQFPFALHDARGRYEIPFGSIERDLNHGEEVPALRWADVNGKAAADGAEAGCALLNDSKYGHSLDGSTLRLTLIRSSYDPDPLPEIGEHAIRLGLAPHGDDLEVGDLVRLGAGLNHPLLVVSTDIHEGRLPSAGSAIAEAGPANVIISSVKKAEDDDALVFRLYETAGRKTTARVTLDPRLAGRPAEAVEVDFLERPLAESTARTAREGFSVALPACGIASVKVRLSQAM